MLLHDSATSHKAAIVREYLKQETVVELPCSPYLTDLASCDYFSTMLEISNAKKSRFGYFSVSEQYTSEIL
jgi:hypothetical protein